MKEPPLRLPILLDSSLGDAGGRSSIPVQPAHITTWTVASSTPGAGPSRRIALEGRDNTIWFHTSPLDAVPSSSEPSPALLQSLPTILTTPDPGSSSDTVSPRLLSRPGASRHASYTGRPRAPSSASSILTTASTSRRRVSAFSPPPSARQLPTATLSNVTALNAHPDGRPHRSSLSDRAELRDHLREQRKVEPHDERTGLGLGIAGLTRRGLSGVHGKDEIEASGTSTPRSIVSVDSGTTVAARLKGWTRASVDKDRNDLQERMEEVEVEREMEKEVRVGEKDKGERRIIEEAIRTPTPREEKSFDLPEQHASDQEHDPGHVKRVVLPEAERGKVVVMKVLEGVGLCLLRDEGLLDVYDCDSLSLIQHLNLENSEPLPPSKVAGSSKDRLRLSPFWQWRGLHLTKNDLTSVVAVHGVPWPCAMPSPNGEVTRLLMLAQPPLGALDIVARLELPGEGDVAICQGGNASYILHTTSTSLVSYPIIYPSSPSAVSSRSTTPKPSKPGTTSASAPSAPRVLSILRPSTPSSGLNSLRDEMGMRSNKPLASPREGEAAKETGFAKFLAARRADWQGAQDKDRESTRSEQVIGIGEGSEVERDGHGGWTRIQIAEGREGMGSADDAIDLFICNGKTLQIKGSIVLPKGNRVTQADSLAGWREVIVQTQDKILRYRREPKSTDRKHLRFSLISTISDARAYTLGDQTLYAVRWDTVVSLDLLCHEVDGSCVLDIATQRIARQAEVILPLDVEKTFAVDKNGNISKRSLAEVLQGRTMPSDNTIGIDRLDSSVTCIRIVDTQRNYLVAGDEDGAVRIWDARSFELQGSWTLFAEPVQAVALLDMAEAGPLSGCLLCISTLGTVAVISMQEMDQLFLIPASRAPLRRIFVGENDILLAYASGKARVWNIETGEFRRSTGLDAGEDMLSSGQWAEVALTSGSSDGSALTEMDNKPSANTDGGRMLELDLRKVGGWVHSSKSNASHSPLSALRALLSMVITFGVDDGIDSICTANLDIPKPAFGVTLGNYEDASVAFEYMSGRQAWQVSALSTGLRQLAIVSLLRPFLDAPDLERWAAAVIAFYTASLPDGAIEPDLEFFAAYYLDSAHDVHQAARMLFESRLDRMSEKEIEAVVTASQPQLASLQDGEFRYSEEAARAMTMIGGMALHKYQSISPSALKAVSESLVLYLSSAACPHLGLAIELCSKGFATWQTYVDPMDLLRRLFQFATHKDSNSPSAANIAAQARLAVLHVASSNPALFMSTLSMDVLDARSAEGRKAIMKLCVFMARKKPEVLENGLPRIAEAVVKSLDPNIGKMRDDVWEAATVILNELVLAFSTIDFHSGTQRLAVGTHEGSLIMYDLKTASRLYVLEPHKAAVSSVNFSPDGRRLVTVSLAEGTVTVWKVGSSLSGFFNVGGPPRQGTKAGEPYKRIKFLRADEGPLPQTSALSDVKVEWPGPRQARVMINETALTFET